LLKKLFGGGRVWGVGCGVWGFTSFEVVKEKVPEFSPDPRNGWHFLRGKKSKSLIQQGF